MKYGRPQPPVAETPVCVCRHTARPHTRTRNGGRPAPEQRRPPAPLGRRRAGGQAERAGPAAPARAAPAARAGGRGGWKAAVATATQDAVRGGPPRGGRGRAERRRCMGPAVRLALGLGLALDLGLRRTRGGGGGHGLVVRPPERGLRDRPARGRSPPAGGRGGQGEMGERGRGGGRAKNPSACDTRALTHPTHHLIAPRLPPRPARPAPARPARPGPRHRGRPGGRPARGRRPGGGRTQSTKRAHSQCCCCWRRRHRHRRGSPHLAPPAVLPPVRPHGHAARVRRGAGDRPGGV